jgi:hypothetical protein
MGAATDAQIKYQVIQISESVAKKSNQKKALVSEGFSLSLN